LQTFSTDRALGGEFFIEVVLAVVDAATGFETLEWSVEARKQVILADRLVISKADLTSPETMARLSARLGELNPHAPIDQAVDGEIDPSCLIEPTARRRTEPGFVAEAAHSDGIISFVLAESAAVAWEPFARAMETLIALRGPDLLRVKGFVDVAGCRGPVLVQFVQHLAHPPVELAAWPDGERRTRLVFIIRGIGERQIRDLFAAVDALTK
jgi:G3E family GTPase